MTGTTVDIIITVLFLVGMALLGLAMLGVSLRVGPTRGTWNQPAAALIRPGRRLFVAMYAIAALHVVAGIVTATLVPGGGLAMLVVLVAMGSFYVLCAHSFALAHAIARRRNG